MPLKPLLTDNGVGVIDVPLNGLRRDIALPEPPNRLSTVLLTMPGDRASAALGQLALAD
ncbi:MAG: hypothetical protein MI741_20875 [Rhodospirillales bacterium]|nr:hypothetical protein [Rhodospirillales bacterium]